jgi:RNA polymerase sigma-70 factor (ECF subfamily)
MGRAAAEIEARIHWAQDALDAINSLTGVQREVLKLGYFEQLSQPEIAARTGLPLSVVKAAAASALRQLADDLDIVTKRRA